MVTVEVSVNGGTDWTVDEQIFVYGRGQFDEVVEIFPTHGPVVGGSMVNISGLSGFDQDMVGRTKRSRVVSLRP